MSDRPANNMLRTILLIVLVLFVLGSLPMWPYASNWGYAPAGGGGLLLIVLLILLISGRI